MQAPKIVIEEIKPFPSESAFVAQYRANVPPPRTSTVTTQVLRAQARDRSGRRREARAAASAINRNANTAGTSNNAAGVGGFQYLLFGQRGGGAPTRGRRGGRRGRTGPTYEEEINNTQSAPQD